MHYKLLLPTTLLLVLAACGSDSGTSTDIEKGEQIPPATLYTGIFFDSTVTGLNYQTSTQSGKTNNAGEFIYQIDETITFSIGGITLPSVPAKNYLTPLDLYKTQDINQTEVINLLRLLQSLDIDGDASNGIEISDLAHQTAENLTVDFTADDFESQVSELLLASGSITQQMIPTEMALEHFQATLDMINNSSLTSCSTEHAKVGYSGYFNTFAHNVSGKATIVDDCTIEISEFSYDGGGPDVFFYAAKDHAYANENAFPLGQRLNGQTYDNASITIKLPINKTMDDLTGLSVWCIDFAANFGQMEFTP